MKTDKLDLTKGNIFKKLLKLSLPIMLANFMMTLYNLADAFWLGKMSSGAADAVSVVGMAFPILFFLSSFGFGFTVAGTSLIAQYKGAGDTKDIKKTIGQFLLIIIIFSAFFIVVSEFFLSTILRLLNTPETIFSLAENYIHLILYGAVFMFFFMAYQSISQGFGDTFSPMLISVFTVVLNIVLDPFMIFGIGIFSKMGTIGAARATLIARVLSAVIAVVFFSIKNKEYIPSWRDLIPDKRILRKILNISIPSSLSQSATSFGFLVLQGFVNSYGVIVISAFTIGNRMISFFMMPAMGISRGLSSMIGQNLGALKIERAKESVKSAMIMVLSIMTFGCALLFFFGAGFTRFFIDNPEVIEIGKRMFRIVAIAANIFGILFVFNGVFNGSGHTKSAMLYNMSRLWLFRIPLVFLLSGKILNYAIAQNSFITSVLEKIAMPLSGHSYDALWWSMLTSNILSTIWAYSIYRKGKWQKAKIFS